MISRVHVAGASSERLMISTYMTRLEETGVHITSHWPQLMDSSGDDLCASERDRYAGVGAEAIDSAHLFWLMVPTCESIGAWVELGYAIGRGKFSIVSGTLSRSIFTSRAHETFLEHDDAFFHIVAWHDRRARVGVAG